jgi:hypothetical protein
VPKRSGIISTHFVSPGVLLFGSLAILTVACWILLPQVPTIDANFKTRSAAAGFLKNELFYMVPLMVFVLPTFRAIVVIQQQLRLGRFHSVLDLLAGKANGVPPRGIWLVPHWFLVAVLLIAVTIGYFGTNNLLDNLREGPHSNLFTAALYVRVSLWYVAAVAGFLWYQKAIDELRREAVAAKRLVEEPDN